MKTLVSPLVAAAVPAGKAIGEVFRYPVLGVHRRVEKIRRDKTTTTDYSLQLRAWELAPLVIGGWLAAWIVSGGLGNGTNKLELFPLGGKLPYEPKLNPMRVNPVTAAILAGLDWAAANQPTPPPLPSIADQIKKHPPLTPIADQLAGKPALTPFADVLEQHP